MEDQQLVAALASCQQALADYQAGLLSDGELRRTLFRAGLVYGTDEAVMLDLESGTWQRYDGITVSQGEREVRPTDITRWRQAVESLRPAAGGKR